MTPLVEFATESLLCHTQDLSTLPDWFTSGRRSLRVAAITAFDVTGDGSALKQMQPLAIDDLPRVMDRFYLWTPRTVPDGRQRLLDTLFETAAPDFEQIIHSYQNRENIRQLMTAISQHYGKREQLQILDFGCGSGLSGEVAVSLGMEVIGYDRCTAMRSAAVGRGLRVISPNDFAALPAASFDAAFASYVFHFGPLQDDLCRLWELVRRGGVVVANFHKDHGLSEVTAYFETLGAKTNIVEPVASRFRHGSYRVYVRL